MTARNVQANVQTNVRGAVRFAVVTLAAVLAVVATALLGRWQMQRAAQKQALAAAVQARAGQAPLSAAALRAVLQGGGGQTAAALHRRVVLHGHWRPEHTVYLDNRQMQGRPGFLVLTPLQLEGSPQHVLVQRGWVARHFQERTHIAAVPSPPGVVQVSGRLAQAPARLLDLGGAGDGAERAPGSSRIRQNLDLAAFAVEAEMPLAPLTVVQTNDASDGLQRQWPALDAGVDKHHGYAFQWFGLSGLIALLYVWFQIVRRIHPRQPPAR